MERAISGYPSIDKPWLRYYSEKSRDTIIPECSIYEFIWRNNKDFPNDIALIFFDRKITYGQLFREIDRTAAAFLNLGIKKGDIVVIMALNQPEVVYTIYALNKIGAIACMINVLSSVDEIEHYLQEGNPKWFITLDLFVEKAYEAAKRTSIRKLVCMPLFNSCSAVKKVAYRLKVKKHQRDDFTLYWNDMFKNINHLDAFIEKHDPHGCSIIGHTGGTTGLPKGVMLSDVAFNSIATHYDNAFVHQRQETLLNIIVPFAIYGLTVNLHMPLSLGMKVVLIPKVDQTTTDRLILKHKPNYVISVPMYWNSVVSSDKIRDLSFLKIAAAGGSDISVEQVKQLNTVFQKFHAKTEFLIGYGMSEVGATACSQMNGCTKLGSVGIPLVKNIVSAFDPDTLEEMQYMQVGEICISGPSLMIGYIDNQEETKAIIKTHRDGKKWIHTGDLGYIDEDGFVFIQGRLKRIYITEYNGALSKIFPDRIEKTILKNEEIEECCVVCYASSENHYKPVVYATLRNNLTKAENIESEIKKICEKELPEYDQPVSIHFLSSMPTTAVGKIDYRELEKRAQELYALSPGCGD